MGHMVWLYAAGFGAVWLAVLMSCVAGQAVRLYRHNWDRAFVRELLRGRGVADRELTSWETDLT